MMRPTFFLLCFLTLACPSWAEVIVTENTQYYPVDGKNKKMILHNLQRQSPIVIQGKKFHGNTKAKTKYNFSWVQRGDSCALKKVTINLSITYKYPKLTTTPDKATRTWWNTHFARLKKHELVHGKIAIKGAYELDNELRSLKKLNCSTAKAKIKTIAKFIFDRTKMRQAKYDQLTEHGKKQERYTGQSF